MKLQDDIAGSIADELRSHFPHTEIEFKPGTVKAIIIISVGKWARIFITAMDSTVQVKAVMPRSGELLVILTLDISDPNGDFLGKVVAAAKDYL